jgi:hypothetical protein
MACEPLHSDAVEHQVYLERSRGYLRCAMACESVRPFQFTHENSRRPMMDFLRFTYSARTVLYLSGPADVRGRGRGKPKAFEPSPDISLDRSNDPSFRLVSYRSRTGVRLLSTRVKSLRLPRFGSVEEP